MKTCCKISRTGNLVSGCLAVAVLLATGCGGGANSSSRLSDASTLIVGVYARKGQTDPATSDNLTITRTEITRHIAGVPVYSSGYRVVRVKKNQGVQYRVFIVLLALRRVPKFCSSHLDQLLIVMIPDLLLHRPFIPRLESLDHCRDGMVVRHMAVGYYPNRNAQSNFVYFRFRPTCWLIRSAWRSSSISSARAACRRRASAITRSSYSSRIMIFVVTPTFDAPVSEPIPRFLNSRLSPGILLSPGTPRVVAPADRLLIPPK